MPYSLMSAQSPLPGYGHGGLALHVLLICKLPHDHEDLLNHRNPFNTPLNTVRRARIGIMNATNLM